MGFFSSELWSDQVKAADRQRHQKKAAKLRAEKAARARNRKHAREHPVSHAWSMFRTRNG